MIKVLGPARARGSVRPPRRHELTHEYPLTDTLRCGNEGTLEGTVSSTASCEGEGGPGVRVSDVASGGVTRAEVARLPAGGKPALALLG
jgi:hypothetical protein